MKTILTFALLALMIAGKSIAQTGTADEVKAISQKRVNWLVLGDLDSLKNLYDVNSITIHGNGMMRSRQEHLEDIKNGRPVYKKIDITESTVTDFGEVAILVGKGNFLITMNGKEMNYVMTYTEVYKKENKAWKLISRQAVEQK